VLSLALAALTRAQNGGAARGCGANAIPFSMFRRWWGRNASAGACDPNRRQDAQTSAAGAFTERRRKAFGVARNPQPPRRQLFPAPYVSDRPTSKPNHRGPIEGDTSVVVDDDLGSI
jgi:hypothetical protein